MEMTLLRLVAIYLLLVALFSSCLPMMAMTPPTCFQNLQRQLHAADPCNFLANLIIGSHLQ